MCARPEGLVALSYHSSLFLILRQAMPSPPLPVTSDPAWAAESNLGRILGITTAVHLLAVTFVALRLYVRIKLVRSPGPDDWTMVAAVVRLPLLHRTDKLRFKQENLCANHGRRIISSARSEDGSSSSSRGFTAWADTRIPSISWISSSLTRPVSGSPSSLPRLPWHYSRFPSL